MQENKKQKGALLWQAIALAVIFVMIIILCVLWFAPNGTLGWLASNRNADAGGLDISVSGGALEFGDVIKVRPVIADTEIDTIYYVFSEEANAYCLVQAENNEDGTLVFAGKIDDTDYYYSLGDDGKPVPINLTGLFPRETLIITLTFRNTTSKSSGYSLSLSDFDDSDGRFTIGEGDGNTSGTYSVMGIFKVELNSITAEGGSPVYSFGEHSGKYLAKYNTSAGTSRTTADPFNIVTGVIAPEDGEVTCTFSISVDLTQYNALSGTVTNLLSKKALSIGALRLSRTS